jgi:hypothetical protein
MTRESQSEPMTRDEVNSFEEAKSGNVTEL